MLSASDQNESKEGHTKDSDECTGKPDDVDKTSDFTEFLTEQGKANPIRISMRGFRGDGVDMGTGPP